jgi:tetratricopeptide (TPR) repeat protein
LSSFFADKDRKIIPRWRDARTAIESNEFNSPVSKLKRVRSIDTSLEGRIRAWQWKPSIVTAADLVSSAVALGRIADAKLAAEFLLQPQSTATITVKRLAHRILGEGFVDEKVGPVDLPAFAVHEESVRGEIGRLRRAIQDTPRNSFLWVDLSRSYATLGQDAQSVRAMEIALRLAPENRFILRSSGRLFVHIGDFERAHHALRSAPNVKQDPWLLAAEIACASVAARTSRLIKTGRALLLNRRWPDFDLAELASAIGTLDLASGDNRAARRLFSVSLRDPNDNALAQAEWVARRTSIVSVDPQLAADRRAYEAQAWKQYRERDWRDAVVSCQLWLMNEPFSSRPTQMASYLALVALGDFSTAERLAAQGLLANPKDATLLNNLTVALANQGKLREAELAFVKIAPSGYSEIPGTLFATQGLLSFRRGDLQEGRALYRRSIEAFARDPGHRALAALHLAREELVAGSPLGRQALSAAQTAASGVQLPEVARFLELLLLQLPTR